MLDKIDERFKKNEKKYNIKANWALVVGIIALIVAPSLFSQLDWGYNFMKTGQIGDTIGGITTPILTLVGSFLVYYSFKQQMAANRIQIDALLDEKRSKTDIQIVDFCDKIQKEIVEKIEKQKLEHIPTTKIDIKGNTIYEPTLTGANAISRTLKVFDSLPKDKQLHINRRECLKSIIIILRNVKLLLSYIEKIDNKDVQEMLINNYYNNLHLMLFVDYTETFLLKLGYNNGEQGLFNICQSINKSFTSLDDEYKVQNKWITY